MAGRERSSASRTVFRIIVGLLSSEDHGNDGCCYQKHDCESKEFLEEPTMNLYDLGRKPFFLLGRTVQDALELKVIAAIAPEG
jgi:hypothetical protein